VARQLDDAIVAVLVLRTIVRSGGRELVREHWPGPPSSLAVLLRLAYGEPRGTEPTGGRGVLTQRDGPPDAARDVIRRDGYGWSDRRRT
jgi:hypothetical protein